MVLVFLAHFIVSTHHAMNGMYTADIHTSCNARSAQTTYPVSSSHDVRCRLSPGSVHKQAGMSRRQAGSPEAGREAHDKRWGAPSDLAGVCNSPAIRLGAVVQYCLSTARKIERPASAGKSLRPLLVHDDVLASSIIHMVVPSFFGSLPFWVGGNSNSDVTCHKATHNCPQHVPCATFVLIPMTKSRDRSPFLLTERQKPLWVPK